MARATYYIESYNNSALIYYDKRIHYQNRMYKIRHDLSVMEWNEHVYRPFTSTYKVDHTKWNWVVEKDGTRKRHIIL